MGIWVFGSPVSEMSVSFAIQYFPKKPNNCVAEDLALSFLMYHLEDHQMETNLETGTLARVANVNTKGWTTSVGVYIKMEYPLSSRRITFLSIMW